MMRRAVLALVATAALTAAAVAVTTQPGVASTRGPLKVIYGRATTAKFPAMVGNYPAGQSEDLHATPPDCTNPTPYCDTIAVDIELPADADPADEFFLTFKMTWVDPTGEGLTDLDAFIWDDKQTTGTGYSEKATAATAANPEGTKLFVGGIRRFNAVVVLFSGVNDGGYTLEFELLKAGFERPFESLAPSFGGGSSARPKPAPSEPSGPPPVDRSGDDRQDAAPAAGPDSALLPDIAVLPDAAFDTFGTGGFDEAIAAPSAARPASNTRSDAEPVGAVVLLFWLGVVPLLLVGTLVFAMTRRRAIAGFK